MPAKLKISLKISTRRKSTVTPISEYIKLSPYTDGPAMILPGLYLSCGKTAAKKPMLESLRIETVINVAKELNITPTTPSTSLDSTCFELPSPGALSGPETPSSDESEDSFGSPTQRIRRLKYDWTHSQDILPVIEEVIQVIEQCQKRGENVLVHCLQGVSRSAALIIGYVMKTRKLPFQQAYEYVRSKSPSISPNVGLLAQLVICESRWQCNDN